MESCGEIININVLMRPDGKPKGIAFVKFSRKSALNNALAKSGEEHMGRSIKIEQARGKATASGDSMPGRGGRNNSFGGKPQFENNAVIETPTLFIGGLSYNSTAESIKEHFASVGAVQSARVVTDR
jgi:nucleolin